MSQRIHLDATPGLFHQVLHCHQGDVGRQFEIAVVTRDGYEIPSGATFKIQATKPSGLGFTVTGTAANNIISFTSTEDMTSEAGEIPTQLEIKSGNDVIYTSNFLLVCEKNTHPASITDGSPEEIISEITLLVERAESAASTAGADAAAAAQARVDEMMDYLPSEVSDLKSDFAEVAEKHEPVNLFNGSFWPVNGYLNGTTLHSGSTYRTTNPIYLKQGTYMFPSARSTFGGQFEYFFKCDSDGTVTQGIAGVDTGETYNSIEVVRATISEAGYYRFNCGVVADANIFMVVKGSSNFPAEYSAYYQPYTVLTDEIIDESKLLKKVITVSENVFNGEIWGTDGYISGGGINPATNYKLTAPVYLEAKTYFYNLIGSNYGNNAKTYLKVNADGTMISAIEGTKTNNTVTISGTAFDIFKVSIAEAGYYMFNAGVGTAQASLFMVVDCGDVSDFPTEYIPYVNIKTLEDGVQLNDTMREEVEEMLGGVVNPLAGKVVSFNGDSICYGEGYAGGYGKIIAERNGMIYENIGASGATITAETYTSGNSPRMWICRTVDNMRADADYVILEGGVNDSSEIADVGTISSTYYATLDDTKFAQAFESMLVKALIRFPGKKIGFIAVHKVADSWSSRNTGEYSKYQIAIDCCKKWGIPVCDLNDDCPPFGLLNVNTPVGAVRTAYTKNGDGWHPNEDGYKKYYCDKIEAWMKTL